MADDDIISIALKREEWGAVMCGLVLLNDDEDWPEPKLIDSTVEKIMAKVN